MAGQAHMERKKSASDLIFNALARNKAEGKKSDLSEGESQKLSFDNLDLDSIKPRRRQVEYSSVKIRTELYERVKAAAEQNGVRQPGKFISLILEEFLKQAAAK